MIVHEKGFTIVEIMIVFLILGISAALAMPNILDLMARAQLKGAARQVMSDLMWARMQAVSEQNAFKIFPLSDHEYGILDDDDNDGKVDGDDHNVTVRFSAAPIFFPRGSALAGTITLTNKSGSTKIKIHLTGRVKMA
jgi:type IV fimbrial biogenesis protein FimT